ncbi:MAG: FtsW/RodA/SpoVE family cell cycle protein [Bacillota bacterium]|nr:FtsW/RodA/SpoVE family cell cycle protein [Bacillota bacterium]
MSSTDQLFLTVFKYLLPLLAIIVLMRCMRSMLKGKTRNETWGYLHADRKYVAIKHWENLIGRSKSADVKLMNPQVSRVHAVLIRSDSGIWKIFDIFSKGGVFVNKEKVRAMGTVVNDNDILTFGNVSLRFRSVTEEQKTENEAKRQSLWRQVHPAVTLVYLTVMQVVLLLEHCISADEKYLAGISLAYVLLILLEWFCYFAMRSIRRTGFEVELLAFFLTTFGLSVIASSVPEEMFTQIIQIFIGVVAFFALGGWLRDLERTKRFRLPIACIALALLAATMVFGEEKYGAKLWFSIGGMSIQPAELVKVAFIYVGAETLERLFRTKNLFVFIAFSALCVIFLALMSDFGTALIFFVTFLVISFMRSGSIATVALAVAGAAMAGFLMFTIKPHVKQRFSVWGHVWEDVFDRGYQQTHALSAGASGGLFGKGAGNGWLKDGFAANADTVFGMLCEELGLIIAICAVLAILALAFFAVRNAAHGRSAYYSIAACAAATMFMVQMALNVFGSVDILPFTGVTFPFVSRGGTSLLSCWMLLAFIKAGDTRKGASFVVKAPDAIKEATENQ